MAHLSTTLLQQNEERVKRLDCVTYGNPGVSAADSRSDKQQVEQPNEVIYCAAGIENNKVSVITASLHASLEVLKRLERKALID